LLKKSNLYKFTIYLNQDIKTISMKKVFVLLNFAIFSGIFAQEIATTPEKTVPVTTTTTTTTTIVKAVEVEQSKKIAGKNEIKLDPFYLVFGAALNVSYEGIINDESAFGVNLILSSGSEINEKFSLSPYYRLYFGRKPAAGFFFEGFAKYHTFDADKKVEIPYNGNIGYYYGYNIVKESKSDFAVGFGIGGKWITRNGIIFELSSGIGRNLLNDYSTTSYNTNYKITGKGGLSIGYRF
jgi:hypothetical protein